MGDAEPVVACLEWNAWYNRQPPDEDPRLHVVGRIRCRSGDIRLSLEPTNEGIVNEADLFVLRLGYSGDLKTDDEVERDVEWADVVEGEIKRVEIRGECAAMIQVKIIS